MVGEGRKDSADWRTHMALRVWGMVVGKAVKHEPLCLRCSRYIFSPAGCVSRSRFAVNPEWESAGYGL
jgi:hypothetical protein